MYLIEIIADPNFRVYCDGKRHHHHMSVMELGHLLTPSRLTYLEVSL